MKGCSVPHYSIFAWSTFWGGGQLREQKEFFVENSLLEIPVIFAGNHLIADRLVACVDTKNEESVEQVFSLLSFMEGNNNAGAIAYLYEIIFSSWIENFDNIGKTKLAFLLADRARKNLWLEDEHRYLKAASEILQQDANSHPNIKVNVLWGLGRVAMDIGRPIEEVLNPLDRASKVSIDVLSTQPEPTERQNTLNNLQEIRNSTVYFMVIGGLCNDASERGKKYLIELDKLGYSEIGLPEKLLLSTLGAMVCFGERAEDEFIAKALQVQKDRIDRFKENGDYRLASTISTGFVAIAGATYLRGEFSRASEFIEAAVGIWPGQSEKEMKFRMQENSSLIGGVLVPFSDIYEKRSFEPENYTSYEARAEKRRRHFDEL